MSFSTGYVFEPCVFSESYWEEKSTGRSCSPAHVSQRSCSSSSCPGSQRVHVTCSLTEEMKRDARKVNLTLLLLLLLLLLPSPHQQWLISNTWQGGLKGSITPWNHKTSKLWVHTCDHNKCLSHHVKRNWEERCTWRNKQPYNQLLCHSASLCAALKQLHGANCDQEWEDVYQERTNLVGLKANSPWELLRDRSVRWQLLTIILLNTAQQMNGINAVRTRWRTFRLPAGSRRVEVKMWKGCCVFKCLFSVFPLDLFLCRLLVQTSWYSQW